MRHTKQCLGQPVVSLRRKSCHECSNAKGRCDQQRPRCSRCVDRNARCEYSTDRHTDLTSLDVDRSGIQGSDERENLFTGTLETQQQTIHNQIPQVHTLDLVGQSMPDRSLAIAFEPPSHQSTPPSTSAQSRTSGSMSYQTVETALTSNQSPGDSDWSGQGTYHGVPDADFSVIRDRWLYPYIEPSPISYALREQSMFYLCRVFRTYPRMMARRERLPPIIHPKQTSKEMPLPLANCFTITRMWEGGAEEASGLVQGTIEREMERLMNEVSGNYSIPCLCKFFDI